jgi:uncharacterized protein (TIGR02118 family)
MLETVMIKVSVMYPFEPEARFDHDYYREIHMPLVQSLLAASCSYYNIDRGLGGSEPGVPPTYVAMCHIYSPSVASFEAGMARSGATILADIPNFTDIKPIVQVSEVIPPFPSTLP